MSNPTVELAEAGQKWNEAKAREREAAAEMYQAIRAATNAGLNETVAAELAGVDRMTVRRAVGKLK